MIKQKRLWIAVLIAMVFVFAFSTVVSAKEDREPLVRVVILNGTNQSVVIFLDGEKADYTLVAPPGVSRTYTVPREVYYHETLACGLKAVGTLDATTAVRLKFTACGGPAMNPGEPTQEKIHLFDAP